MHTSLRTIALGVALLITGTSATVSLSSFTPRINNIPNSQCESAYTTIIKGCQASDFGKDALCSAACVQGLQEITVLVQSRCKGVDVGETSIIGVFQIGIGIQSLCPKNSDTSSTSSSSSTTSSKTSTTTTQAVTSTTSTLKTTSSTAASSTITVTSTTTLNTESSQAAQSSASSSQGLIVDPNPTSIAGVSPTGNVRPPASSTAAARPPQPQLSNQDSGGGSPFDVQATGDSSRRTVPVLLASVVGTVFLFGACA